MPSVLLDHQRRGGAEDETGRRLGRRPAQVHDAARRAEPELVISRLMLLMSIVC
jgi:hypothetical protein